MGSYSLAGEGNGTDGECWDVTNFGRQIVYISLTNRSVGTAGGCPEEHKRRGSTIAFTSPLSSPLA